MPTPTVPPASSDIPQSTRAFTAGTGVPPGGAPELLLEIPALHPAFTSSQQRAAAPRRVRATRSMFMVRFSLEIIARLDLIRLVPGLGRLDASPVAPRFHPRGGEGLRVNPHPLLRGLRLRGLHVPAHPLMYVSRLRLDLQRLPD